MRILDFAFALIIFNISMGMLNVAIEIDTTLHPLMGAVKTGQSVSQTNSTITQFVNQMNQTATSMKSQQNIIQAVFNYLNIAYYGFIITVTIIWSLISSTIFGFMTLGQLVFCSFGGGPACSMGMVVFGFIQVAVWIIYAIGISQWVSGRSYKEYQ